MRVAFRVDASEHIGAGHFVRCVALAERLRAVGGECHFFCAEIPDALAAGLAAHGHGHTRLAGPAACVEDDARRTVAALGGEGYDWLIVDHYRLGSEWEGRMRPAARRILVIDDLADRTHDCDVLLNPSLDGHGPSSYAGKVPARCRLLLGPAFALLRPEFARLRAATPPRSGPVRRILVTSGGADAGNHTSTVLRALRTLRIEGCTTDVVIGAANRHRGALEGVCREAGFVLHVQTDRIAELMCQTDLAIGAGGSTTWELCCLGVPSILFAVAENQRPVIERAALAGAIDAPDLGAPGEDALALHVRALIRNPLRRQWLSHAARRLVDGRGAIRAVRAMGIGGVEIRRVVAADAAQILEWRNHPEVRCNSRSTEPIDAATHRAWLEGLLRDPSRLLLIGEHAGRPLAVVRFDVRATRAEVSIYRIFEAQREEGMPGAADVLAAAERWLEVHRPDVREIVAEVKAANERSHALFAHAGYASHAVRYLKELR